MYFFFILGEEREIGQNCRGNWLVIVDGYSANVDGACGSHHVAVSGPRKKL